MSKEPTGVKVFRVKGTFRGKKEKFTFVKEIRALSEREVKEIIYSEIGSNHEVKRTHIKFEEITPISPEEAKNPIIRYLSGLEM
ncbi:MAG: 50S ribosomal protein L18Ae [Candidatus Freyarchaeota archaeon]